jgi:hypothetical protein
LPVKSLPAASEFEIWPCYTPRKIVERLDLGPLVAELFGLVGAPIGLGSSGGQYKALPQT